MTKFIGNVIINIEGKIGDKMKKMLIGFILGGIIFGSAVYAVSYNASDITYTKDGVETNVNEALDELYVKSNFIFEDLVEPMSSGNDRLIVAPGSDPNGGYAAFHAFDGDINTRYISSSSLNDYIGYDFLVPVRLCLILYIGDTNYRGFGNSTIQGSNDGNEWIDVEQFDGGKPNIKITTSKVDSTEYYRYWRIVNNESYRWGFWEVQFFGIKK